MHRQQSQAYRDQFEYLAESFELIRKRGDAYNIRSEALESERMVAYTERTGFASERSHLLEIYRDLEAEVVRAEEMIELRKAETGAQGRIFPFDDFVSQYGLSEEETQILLVLLYNESLGRSHARFATGTEILNLLFPNPVTALKASRYLGASSSLFKHDLVRVLSDDGQKSVLKAAYEVTERTLHDILGIRGRNDLAEQAGVHSAAATPDQPFRVVKPRVSLEDVVLSPEHRNRLDEVLWQAGEGKGLFGEWGLDALLEKGKGTVVLFSGPPGTGKTMSAEAMAQALGRDLHVADFAQLESKWIGETEKNIVAVFAAAAEAGAVLLLDEADAILACRLDGGHYNDRAYNRQVSILLTELEAFEGLCVLTTNRPVVLDEGLARRVSATFDFPVPGSGERERIWRRLLPQRVPLAADVDLADLAERFPMAGGHIKNAILGAARAAAQRGGQEPRVTQVDLKRAAAQERKSFRPDSRPIGFREPVNRPSYS